MKKLFLVVSIATTLLIFNSCKKNDFHDPWHSPNANAGVAIDWYKLQLRILLERNSSFNGVYFGYYGIALYEAVRNATHGAVSLSSKLYQMPEMPSAEKNKSYNWEVSANATMASMLRSYNTGLTPANLVSIDSLENYYNQKLKPGCGEQSFNRSQAYGKSIATAVYNWSLTDNFNGSNAGYVPPVFPGAWVPTLPAFANGVNPFISAARPFLPENTTAVAPPFPAAYSEDVHSDFYKIVKHVYDVNLSLTTAQKDIALYWVDQGNGVGFTPPGHDFSLITQALEKANVSLVKAAEVYAKTGIAERDATLVCFRSKYKYSLVRPITYIRNFIDPKWLPFIVTPPHPEYPAAHAFITGSVMKAAANVLGKNFNITDHTYDFRGFASRSYPGLFQAAQECGMSRLYGGIHYLESVNIGLSLAGDFGDRVGKIQLLNNFGGK